MVVRLSATRVSKYMHDNSLGRWNFVVIELLIAYLVFSLLPRTYVEISQ
jgi:hypothetical protein